MKLNLKSELDFAKVPAVWTTFRQIWGSSMSSEITKWLLPFSTTIRHSTVSRRTPYYQHRQTKSGWILREDFGRLLQELLNDGAAFPPSPLNSIRQGGLSRQYLSLKLSPLRYNGARSYRVGRKMHTVDGKFLPNLHLRLTSSFYRGVPSKQRRC